MVKMKNGFMIFVIILLVVGAGIFFMRGSNGATGNVVSGVSGNSGNSGDSGQIQKVTLSIKNGNYYPQNVKVKQGQTVRIYLDKSVGGCYRSFTMRDFGVAKYLASDSDYVEFTPNKKGSFRFACSMGMATGTLVVE